MAHLRAREDDLLRFLADEIAGDTASLCQAYEQVNVVLDGDLRGSRGEHVE